MNKNLVENTHHQTFESLREGEEGFEFWRARKLSKTLEYYEYRNFLPVVEKAKEACKNSGHAIEDHFVEVNEMVEKLLKNWAVLCLRICLLPQRARGNWKKNLGERI